MKSINQFLKTWAEENNISTAFAESIDSTSTWAKRDFNNSDFSLFLADNQTRGRGRNQNRWVNSESGSTLLSTWCLRTESAPQPIFPMRVGLCLYEAFQQTWPHLNWSLKAPNDIYLSEKKIAGILVEAEQTGNQIKVFIGIGANFLNKPQVDQPTVALTEMTSVDGKDVGHFFFLLTQGLRNMQKDPQRQNLLNTEQDRLLDALKNYPNNQITAVAPNGTLTLTDNSVIHWQSL
jgi:BirA family transcriptional regulator, biotin operon repressor / biotin---[acetyl-CoA-carboxylase] ligase